MEIYGPFLEEDELFVEEIRRRKDFNNILMNFESLPGRVSYRDHHAILKTIFSKDADNAYAKKKVLWKSIDQWVAITNFDIVGWLKGREKFSLSEGLEFENYEVELAPLYIHLRKKGFSEEIIIG